MSIRWNIKGKRLFYELPYLLVREIGKFGWFADNNVMKGFCCVIGGYQQARLALTFGQPKREREREIKRER